MTSLKKDKVPVVVIGAGPAGLAVSAHLRQRGIPFVVLEESGQVGSAWHRHYDRLHLHTVKELSHLPFLPFPTHYPRYVSRKDFAEYLEGYARYFQISPRFGTKVLEVQRSGNGGWAVYTAQGETIESAVVVVATGVNRVPERPVLVGEEYFSGSILHSREYRNGKAFVGKNVLVVGMGNTGAEIALDLYEQGAHPWISVRGPVNIVPRDFLGRPTQLTALKVARLPTWLGDHIGKLLRRIAVGDLSRFGIRYPRLSPAAQLRQTGQTPVIDLGTVEKIKSGGIQVVPAIQSLSAQGALFADGRQLPFEAIILATGYRPGLPEFLGACPGLLDVYGLPKACIGIQEYSGLYFVGFDNYTAGGILGVIQRDSERVVNDIAQQLHRPV
jgi:cation diffusion facilitator CzcD-associated flavoprotein CzcO